MAATINFTASQANDGAQGAWSPTMTAALEGDVAICVAFSYDRTIATPTDWTLVDHGADLGDLDAHTYCWKREIASDGEAVTFTPSANTSGVFMLAVVSGADYATFALTERQDDAFATPNTIGTASYVDDGIALIFTVGERYNGGGANGAIASSPTGFTLEEDKYTALAVCSPNGALWSLEAAANGSTSGLSYVRTPQPKSAWIGVVTLAASTPPPINTVAPVASGTPQVAQTLSCTTGTWDPVGDSYAYQWKYNDGSAHDIAGATSATWVVDVSGAVDLGDTVYCAVTATNGGGSVTANSNSLVLVATPAGGGVTAPLSQVILNLARRR